MIEQEKLILDDPDIQTEKNNSLKDALFRIYHSIHSINQTSFGWSVF